jgi:hypothetical protein
MNRVAITGVDGTGKTTLVRALAAAEEPGLVAFRAPQYHEHPAAPRAALARAIDAMSEHADASRQPALKAVALFMSMTLYGEVERQLETALAPVTLVGERQCYLDSLAYARFYRPLLARDLDEAALAGPLAASLGDAGLAEVLAWAVQVARRDGAFSPDGLWRWPTAIAALFGLPTPALLTALEGVYAARWPDRVILLTLSEAALGRRLEAKWQQAGAPPRELHEQHGLLLALQAALAEVAAMAANLRPGLHVETLDVSEATPDEALAACRHLIAVASRAPDPGAGEAD